MTFKPKTMREPLTEAELYEYAVGALGRRMRTVSELKRLMRPKVEKGETGEVRIEAVVARLKERRYLDDTAFAADYTRLRQEGAKFGKRRVQQDLKQKGVDGELIETTLTAAYEHVDEESLARQYLSRKRIPEPADQKGSVRVMRQLVRAGFSVGVIYKLLKQWNVPDETLAVVESLDLEPQAGQE